MKIREYFQKSINRHIETVIKADDKTNISDEVVEYVITNEISKKIQDFFQAYIDYNGVNGVWISGFFGSGKSHLLKIMSYVLENKKFDGYESGELFAEKIEGDEMLKGDVLKASQIPSESILFNIDQQSQITSKSDENAVLSVFYKVFYDHLGFYGFQPHVAEFEMWLAKSDNYESFKELFDKKSGKSWEDARIDYFDPEVTDVIKESLSEIFNKPPDKYDGILDELEDRSKQSIENFCNQVADYINIHEKGFHLNFFVDEVGQYISENTKLMLNLQTIAETLATKCGGNSWIIVTSQEDMEKVVGAMNKKQMNDFSRIMARFKIKIPLTSANVDEVIEKRLLKKKNEGYASLEKSWKKNGSNIETLLSFSDVGVQFKGYRNSVDYCNKFPFIPYQFDLFIECRRALSTHNAFQGKHASVGERSMLGVFQQVLQQINDQDGTTLVSFAMMFDGIRKELRSEIQSSILLAEKNLGDEFAVGVLKTLFLVKYFRNFKTTKRNINVLLIDSFNVDIKNHEIEIDKALNKLENQSYIQRNGDIYEFLTDDEKDVEEDIKATNIDDNTVTQLFKEVFFDEIIRDNRLTFHENKQDYDFTNKIDGAITGREKELEIEIITENSPEFENLTYLKTQTMGSSGMKMVLPSDSTFMKDVKMYLRVAKYVKQNQSTTNRVELKRILQEKAQQNVERRKNIIFKGRNLLGRSAIYINGGEVELKHSTDGKTRVEAAFQLLIKNVYSHLKMLGRDSFTEKTIANAIRTTQEDLFGMNTSISEAESEILNYIQRRKLQSERTTLTDLKTNFTKKPFGWYANAIWTLAAKLCRRGRIEFKQGSDLLQLKDVLTSLLNSAKHPLTIVEIQTEIDSKNIKRLKQVYGDLFDESCPQKEAKDVALAFKGKLNELDGSVTQFLMKKNEYSFLECLDSFSKVIERLINREYTYYLKNIDEFEDKLLDFKEDYLDPIKRFMNGEQRNIYDAIRKLLLEETSNLQYLQSDDLSELKTLIQHSSPYKGNLVKNAKSAFDRISARVLVQVEQERQSAIECVENIISNFKEKNEYASLGDDKQSQLILPFDQVIKNIQSQQHIANIKDLKTNTKDQLFENQLNNMMELVNATANTKDSINEPVVEYVSKHSIKVNYNKAELLTEEDVDNYVAALEQALKELIRKNKRIVL